jgi:Flp pilus assembly protein TadG
MIVFLGFCALSVDYGLLVNDKNRLQRAADAAALAAAQELKSSSPANDAADRQKASNMAVRVASLNGVTVTPSNVTFNSDSTHVTVVATGSQPMYFARAIGIPVREGSARAVAGTTLPSPPIEFPGPVPISITDTTVLTRRASIDPEVQPVNVVNQEPVELDTPRVQEEPYGLNQFLVFDLRGGGASPPQMQNQLVNGYRQVQKFEWHRSLNASQHVIENNFVPALETRFQRAAQGPWNDRWTGDITTSNGIRYNEILTGANRADNPRVMSIIVNKPSPQSGGNTFHQILAFVPVYVVSWGDDKMTVRFLPDSLFAKVGGGGSNEKTVTLIE